MQKRLFLRFLPIVIFWGGAAGMAGLATWLADLPFWPAFVVALLAMLINGGLATLEDDLPGGFNNPDGLTTPQYARIVRLVLSGVAVALVLVSLISVGLWVFG